MQYYYEFRLPDIGEGTAEGEILKWLVAEGDSVKEDQPVVEVVTDKVNVEIPSPKTGKISKILAREGDVVKVGQGLVLFEVEDESLSAGEPSRSTEASSPNQAVAAQSMDVGTTERSVLATPATRKLARELGVDMKNVKGSGPAGRVTIEDVKKSSEKTSPPLGTVPGTAQKAPAVLLAGEEEERVPLRGIRKTIAERMVMSIHSAAHVTHVDEVDVTELVSLRNKLKMVAEEKRVELTFLPMFIKAVIPALKEFPYINASIDEENSEIVLKKYYNIGIATDTDQGLIVPVIKDADKKKGIFELAAEIENLVGKARAGKLSLDEVHDSTFTLTSVGSIGGLFSTPIINYPEVAILGIQRIVKRPVVRNDAIAIRDMMNLSFSFDHRVIDGAYAARFVNRVIELIEDTKNIIDEASV
ncbi:MAG: dihydrolipoamide acetyltransferase family protein [Nitrososphaerales archaeon]